MRTEYAFVNQPTVFFCSGEYKQLIDRNKPQFSEVTFYDEHFKSKIIFFDPFFFGVSCCIHAHRYGSNMWQWCRESALCGWGFSWNMISCCFLSCAYHNAANGFHCSKHAVCVCAREQVSAVVIFRYVCMFTFDVLWWIEFQTMRKAMNYLEKCAIFFEVRRNGMLSSVKSDAAAGWVRACTCMDKHLFNLSVFGVLQALPIRWNSVDAVTFDSHDANVSIRCRNSFNFIWIEGFLHQIRSTFFLRVWKITTFTEKMSYMLWFERLWSAKTIRINGNVHKKEAEKSTRKKNRSEIEGRTFHLFDIWNVIKWLWLRLIRIVCHMNNVSFVIEEWIPFMGVDSDTSTANKSQYIMRNSMNWRR